MKTIIIMLLFGCLVACRAPSSPPSHLVPDARTDSARLVDSAVAVVKKLVLQQKLNVRFNEFVMDGMEDSVVFIRQGRTTSDSAFFRTIEVWHVDLRSGRVWREFGEEDKADVQ